MRASATRESTCSVVSRVPPPLPRPVSAELDLPGLAAVGPYGVLEGSKEAAVTKEGAKWLSGILWREVCRGPKTQMNDNLKPCMQPFSYSRTRFVSGRDLFDYGKV